jgi:SpoVK/Ycf46/Vps4 family AAA+-type ATPase
MSDGTSALFELELELPNTRLKKIADRLVGFADRFARMHQDLRLLVDKDGLEKWSNQFYPKQRPAILDSLDDRYPLVIFHGDVGTGKTATAEAAANALTTEMKRDAMLFKLSTRVRGTGNVGEMSALINQAFEIVAQQAGKSKLSFLIIDEADSLASSRNVTQSHHEDKVAVNTLIQKIDDVRRFNGRVLVIFSTNRFDALDPAIVRRAARIEEFTRPNDVERRELFKMDCEGLGFDENTIVQLVKLTGSKKANDVPYTFSDLRTRLIPEALAHAYPQRKIEYNDFAAAAKKVVPSPALV